MNTQITNSTIETLLNHRSVRQFTDEKIDEKTLNTILNVGRAVSTSSFLQAASVVRITDKTMRTQFRQISNNMDEETYNKALADGKKLGHGYVESAPEFLVFCMDGHRHANLAPEVQLDWTEVLLIGTIDAALFAQNVMAAAESLGLGGVYIGSMRNDIKRASTMMNLPEHVVPLFGLCLGHPTESAKKVGLRPRLPLSILVSENQYRSAGNHELNEYNEIIKKYYDERGVKGMDWQKQIHSTFAKPARPHILPYLQEQGFAKK